MEQSRYIFISHHQHNNKNTNTFIFTFFCPKLFMPLISSVSGKLPLTAQIFSHTQTVLRISLQAKKLSYVDFQSISGSYKLKGVGRNIVSSWSHGFSTNGPGNLAKVSRIVKQDQYIKLLNKNTKEFSKKTCSRAARTNNHVHANELKKTLKTSRRWLKRSWLKPLW